MTITAREIYAALAAAELAAAWLALSRRRRALAWGSLGVHAAALCAVAKWRACELPRALAFSAASALAAATTLLWSVDYRDALLACKLAFFGVTLTSLPCTPAVPAAPA